MLMRRMNKILGEAIAILITETLIGNRTAILIKETLMGNRTIPICRSKKKLLTARTRRMLRIKIHAIRNLSRFYYYM
jgi:hypothetical protein